MTWEQVERQDQIRLRIVVETVFINFVLFLFWHIKVWCVHLISVLML